MFNNINNIKLNILQQEINLCDLDNNRDKLNKQILKISKIKNVSDLIDYHIEEEGYSRVEAYDLAFSEILTLI